MASWQPQLDAVEVNGGPVKGGPDGVEGSENQVLVGSRQKIVVVGLGMVGISFIEKLMKLDAKRREWDVVVVGEERHLAYNRVGLTSFFQHRKVENLYLNPREWVCIFSLLLLGSLVVLGSQ